MKQECIIFIRIDFKRSDYGSINNTKYNGKEC